MLSRPSVMNTITTLFTKAGAPCTSRPCRPRCSARRAPRSNYILLTTGRLVWQCAAHTAEPKFGQIGPIPPIPYYHNSVARGAIKKAARGDGRCDGRCDERGARRAGGQATRSAQNVHCEARWPAARGRRASVLMVGAGSLVRLKGREGDPLEDVKGGRAIH